MTCARAGWLVIPLVALLSGCILQNPDGNDCEGDECAETARCDDGEHNGEETDVDCGGPDCKACRVGKACDVAEDCASGQCVGGTCKAPETCNADGECAGDRVCQSGDCVSPASCDDGKINGSESGVDCGGRKCEPCGVGETCRSGSDCQSGKCLDQECAPGDGPTDAGDTRDFDTVECEEDIDCEPGRECRGGVCRYKEDTYDPGDTYDPIDTYTPRDTYDPGDTGTIGDTDGCTRNRDCPIGLICNRYGKCVVIDTSSSDTR